MSNISLILMLSINYIEMTSFVEQLNYLSSASTNGKKLNKKVINGIEKLYESTLEQTFEGKIKYLLNLYEKQELMVSPSLTKSVNNEYKIMAKLREKGPIIEGYTSLRETNRTIYVKYCYVRETNVLTYAAVFMNKKSTENKTMSDTASLESFVKTKKVPSKKELRKTVDKRYTNKPVVVSDFKFTGNLNFRKNLRQCIVKYGVCTKTHKTKQ